MSGETLLQEKSFYILARFHLSAPTSIIENIRKQYLLWKCLMKQAFTDLKHVMLFKFYAEFKQVMKTF